MVRPQRWRSYTASTLSKIHLSQFGSNVQSCGQGVGKRCLTNRLCQRGKEQKRHFTVVLILAAAALIKELQQVVPFSLQHDTGAAVGKAMYYAINTLCRLAKLYARAYMCVCVCVCVCVKEWGVMVRVYVQSTHFSK
jgi:hypothetical protein